MSSSARGPIRRAACKCQRPERPAPPARRPPAAAAPASRRPGPRSSPRSARLARPPSPSLLLFQMHICHTRPLRVAPDLSAFIVFNVSAERTLSPDPISLPGVPQAQSPSRAASGGHGRRGAGQRWPRWPAAPGNRERERQGRLRPGTHPPT